MTAFQLCKFCRDNNVMVVIRDYSYIGQSVTVYRVRGNDKPDVKCKFIIDPDMPDMNDDIGDTVFENFIEKAIRSIEKKIQEDAQNNDA